MSGGGGTQRTQARVVTVEHDAARLERRTTSRWRLHPGVAHGRLVLLLAGGEAVHRLPLQVWDRGDDGG